ncbi:hypothetical protein [Bosea sp. ANAM02]|uniref:hypothetical protein n=1 Tax=Bosea sp. ANAM02 TaxID=2020412 RepID=UPI00140ED8FE|nr:hypothetical protein [Bosea sp. ANAM02]BCB22547.1 hypothetical protein OCUBac02_54410 [Bosea sp. ANAM02]
MSNLSPAFADMAKLEFRTVQGEHGPLRVAEGLDGASYGSGPIDGRDRLWRRTADGAVQTLAPQAEPFVAEEILGIVHQRATGMGILLQARWPVHDHEGTRTIETVPVTISRDLDGITIAPLTIGAGRVELHGSDLGDTLLGARRAEISNGPSPRAQKTFDEQVLSLLRMVPGLLTPGEGLMAAYGQAQLRQRQSGARLNETAEKRFDAIVEHLSRALDDKAIEPTAFEQTVRSLQELRRGLVGGQLPPFMAAFMESEVEPAVLAVAPRMAEPRRAVDLEGEAVAFAMR